MASKSITSDALALTEKKMEMSLDDIIKMSKKTFKGKKPSILPIKSQGVRRNGGVSQSKSAKVQNFMESRSSIRQGVLAHRRSNFPGGQFQLTKEVSRRAASFPIRNRAINWKKSRVAPVLRKFSESHEGGKGKLVPKQRQTLDARFADMKVQRMIVTSQPTARGGESLYAPVHLGPQRQMFRGGMNRNWNAPRRQGVQQQRVRSGAGPSGPGRHFSNKY